MKKVSVDFVKHSYMGKGPVTEYSKASKEVGLWSSEEMLFQQYLKKEDRILDLGCGAGRVAMGLYKLDYRKVTGLDLSDAMIEEAKEISEGQGMDIEFVVGDATQLEFVDGFFDVVIFAFNGWMQIPGQRTRMKALSEIRRVLKPGGLFLFTTHDRDYEKSQTKYWAEEEALWRQGQQDPRFLEFGDLIYKNYDREMYLHVPSRQEVFSCLALGGFTVIEDHMREEIHPESYEVREFSDECRMWVAKKN